MSTIHELRLELEAAQAKYVAADIEHPTAVLVAKDTLTNARFDYWAACADLVTRLPAAIQNGSDELLVEIYAEITGEQL